VTDYRRLMEEENPYLELMRQEESDALRSAMYGAAQTNPDVEADLRKLAEKVNVPVETVRIDRKEIERQAILGEVDYDGLVKDSPVTANFLAEQADVARDDVSVLTRIDRTFRAAGQGIEQASIMDQVEPLNWRWVSGEFLSPAEQTLRRELLNKMQALGKTPERGDNPIAWVFGQTGYTARQLVSSVREGGKGAIIGAAAGAGGALLLGQAGPQVAVPEEILTVPGAFALGGSAGYKLGTLVYSYKSEAGFAFVEYEQMRDESGQLIDPAVARGAAAAAGLLNAGLETIGDIALAKRIPGIDRLLGAGSREAIKTLLARPTFRNAVAQAGKKWLQSASIEGVTESIQELIVILGRELAQGVSGQEFAPEAADSDLMRVLESGAAGFAGGAGVGLPGSTISAVSNVREVRKANQTQQFMQALGEAAGESKLRERLPQVFQDYVARIREQGPVENVFIPADQFTQYWQSQNVDPEQVANEVGATNYTEAVATGSDVVIPIEAYATRLAPTPHHSGLMKDVRLAQGDLTIREVEALEARRKEVEAEIQTMMEQEGVEVETPAIEQVKQEVLGQLLGRFDRATADNYATLYARAINSLAQRGGMDPMELHRQYGLEVVTPLPDILQARAGVDTALDPLIDRLRSGDIPSRREIYGKSLAEFLRERGGVQDQGGELGARDAKLWDRDNRRVGEKALVSETGMTFDEARELALEAGFDVGETEQTFLDAMDREFRGDGVFMPGKERADLAELADALEGLEQFLGQQGIDITTTDNATIKALIAKASEGMGDVGVQFAQTATVRAGRETLKKFGLDPNKTYKTREIAAALEARQRAKYGSIAADNRSPEAVSKIAKWMVAEIEFEMQNPEKSGVGWYSEKFQRAIDIMAETFPELKADKTARNTMTALIAITSDGQKVVPNFAQAMDIYGRFRPGGATEGKFTTTRGHQRQASIDKNLQVLQRLYDQMTPEQVHEYLMQERTISDLKKLAKQNGGEMKSDYQAHIKMPMAAIEFGPKLGAFYANLMGAHGYLTMDRWWSRTFNRYRGSLLTKPTEQGLARFKQLLVADKKLGVDPASISDDEAISATVEYHNSYEAKGFKSGTEIEKAANTLWKAAFDALEDAPFNATDRTFMLNAVNQAQKTLERKGKTLSVADIQAILWYYEKRLYGELGARQTADISYEEAARKVTASYASGSGIESLLDDAGAAQEDGGAGEGRVPVGEDNFVEGDGGGDVTLFQSTSTEDKRGFIQFGTDRKVRIGLLEKADLSTFIHETGHFYLEVLLDLAERPDASPQIKADAETLMKWFGVKSRAEIGVKQHEEFARANEAYLMEGKAPSAELRTIFQRVRAWMTLVYRVLTNLNVRMNDDVRGVFDRIYATDKEIESANAELDVREVFASAQDAGMTEAEFAAYKKTAEAAGEAAKEKLQGRLIREYQREREKWWKAERAKMLEKVTEEVDSSPAYRAAAILTEGKLPDGVPVKLSRKALEDRFGSEYLKRMPRFLRKVYTKDGGTDIDTAAEMLGFESGEALMTALINLRPRKELIEAETANRMAAEFGDMRMDGTIADEAMAAIHNSERANVLKAELVAIRRLQRQVRPVVAALRREEAEQRRAGMDMVDAAMADPQAFARAAAGRIGQMMARDISPGKYLLAERRASKAAFDAIRRKDYNAAATEKQRELLNHYMYLEARKAQQQLDRIYDYANKFDKKATRERLAKAGGGYLDQIDAILEKYEFRRVPLRVLARRQSLADFAEQQAALGLIVNVPDQLLDEARLVNYKNASVDELRAVYDTVRNIEHLARLKDKLLRKAAAVEFQETKDELIKSATESDRLATTGELRIPNTVGEPLRARGAKAWRRFDAAILKVEQMVEWLDNGKIDGPWARFVFDLANDAQVKEYELHAMVTQKIQDLTESMPKGWGDSLTDKVDVLLPGIESPVTRYTLISIAMNVGNDSNYQRLRDGYGWSDSSINAALGKLAKEDWDYIQGIWDAVNSLWPEIKALEERTSGVAPPKVDPRVVQTRFGDYRGGYFPLAYDPKLSAVGDKQAEATESVSQFMSNAYGRARTDRGYTKQRVENLKAAVRLDYEQVLTSHLTKVIKDISHREAIFSLNKILKDEEIKEVMIDRLGEARYREFTKWMQVLVSDRADTLHSGNVFSRAIMQFRTNMAIVTMGWKVTTMMAQFAGIGPALDTVKPRFFTQALIDYNRFGPWSTHRETLEQFVYDRSGEMKFRSDNIDRDVRDSLRTLRGEVGPLAAIRRSAFYLTAMADRQITIPTWIGAYRQALAEGLGEEDAIRAGDRAVRLSQGAAGAKDLAAVQRDNELMKLLTMYYTPFSVLYARMRDVGATTRRVRDMPRAVARMLALVILPAVLGEILAGRGPDEDEDETWWAIRKMLLYPLASVPILKEGSGVVEATMINLTGEGEMAFQPSWRLSPVAGSIEKVGRTFMRTSDVLAGDREFNDVAWDLFESSGYIFGLPTRQVRISGEYTMDVLNDERNPESPQQFMYEVLYGPPRE